MKTINYILCFFFGHKKLIPMLQESQSRIYARGCPRCKRPAFFSGHWKDAPAPPGMSDKKWEKFREKYNQEFRDEVNKSIKINSKEGKR